MKYIELYLNERKEELEKLKKEEIEKFKDEYQNCVNDDDIENLMEDVVVGYYIMIDSYNMRLQEIANLRNDLIPKEDLESKGE
ncbi:MAG: hypothetical protein IJ690_01985 [Clostridia bacterium]|nr:hypothetical protein [Clostridia bacterium]MBR1653711.1 hypothetical protein [Clostridia bacterium]